MTDLFDVMGFEVVDARGERVGRVENLWAEHGARRVAFLGVRAGGLFGHARVVPADRVEVDEDARVVRLPFDRERVESAPVFDLDRDLPPEEEARVRAHFAVPADRPPRREDRGEVVIPLAEEELRVSAREVVGESLRLRKVVRAERVREPVELRRETIHVERVAVPEETPVPESAFREEEVEIVARREEPVIERRARVASEVRAWTTRDSERRVVEDTVRREDVEVERSEPDRWS